MCECVCVWVCVCVCSLGLSCVGVAPSCQVHAWASKTHNYTYLIDPDGPHKRRGRDDPSKWRHLCYSKLLSDSLSE